jgi:uncharacterized GH25 family protein
MYDMKKWPWITLVTAVCLVVPRTVSLADDRVTLTGRVTDAEGKPIEHARVMVHHAGVKKGYSTFCPSCYADCGKRAITDNNGTFTFKHLSPDLWFELLVARDGYEPVFTKKVDPSSGTPVSAKLVQRKIVSDSDRVFRGRVEDSHGLALRDAVVQPVGLLLDSKTGSSRYGTIEGLDPVAISNEKGEFEIAYSRPGLKILVSVEARGMAPAFRVIPAGLERHAITIVHGATVRGRLVQGDKPVGDAEVGLNGRPRGGFGVNLELSGYNYDEIRIGTQPDGTFAITNVPAPMDCYIYGKMESVAMRGATGAVECATKHDKEIVDVGDLQIKPAHRLQGRVVLSDGKPIPDGMRVTISSERAWDTQTAMLPPEGRFEFVGLAAGTYSVFASVKGYTLPKTPVSVEKKKEDGTVEITTYAAGVAPPFSIDHDLDDFVITLHPENEASQ